MSSDKSDRNVDGAKDGRYGSDGRDRRRRRRVKVALPVRIRGGMGSVEFFDDDGTTIDVSRDGMLLMPKRGGYASGQVLEVIVAAAGEPTAGDSWQRARVVRTILMPDRLSYAVALEYQKFAVSAAGDEQKSSLIVRVLVVEPDANVATVTRKLLEQEGYEVVNVSNGKEALELLRTFVPDVLLAEVEGSEVNGQELCSIIKKSIRLQHIPVILLTRSAQVADYSASHKVGAVMCMAMPCHPGKLQQVVRLVARPLAPRETYSTEDDMPESVKLRN